MPITMEAVKDLPKGRPKAGLVDWEKIIDQVLKSGQYFSSKEITDSFVEGKVKVFRTKAVLDKAVEDGVLERFWHERRYVYGRPLKK